MSTASDPRSVTIGVLRETSKQADPWVARELGGPDTGGVGRLAAYGWADAASPLAGNWFSALRSPHIARALACIHETPANDWTLDTLAKAAGLSRSTFAAQFRNSVGEPPYSYLIRWRIGIAAQLLEHTGLRLAEIAARVGYRSEFSFSRAFARARGLSPGQFRSRASLT